MSEEKLIEKIANAKRSLAKKDDITIKEYNILKSEIRSLLIEYNELMIKGCNPCSDCGKMPMGIHLQKKIIFKDKSGKKKILFAPYEIGCVHGCINKESLNPGEKVEQNLRTWATTRDEAADNWNKRIFYLRVYPVGTFLVTTKNK